MAKTKISQYDATAANNTDIDSINIAEGMAPSNVNNAIRELMAHLKDMDAGTQALTSPQLTSADINGGTIDGVTIGGASAGAGTFTNLTATGTTTLAGASTSADITFGDNDKATFGAGSDLQIYHDGSDSIIRDVGTGDLRLRGTSLAIEDSSGNEFIRCSDGGTGGTVFLKHLGAIKLATTSTGIDVTGTVTADGLTVDGASPAVATFNSTSNGVRIEFNGASTPASRPWEVGVLNNADGDFQIYQAADAGAGDIKFYTDGTLRQNIDAQTGDISFYEDTGTTAKFFWDASAEVLEVNKLSALGDQNTKLDLNIANTARIFTGGLERMRITSSGSVGIGTSSPETILHATASSAIIRLTSDANGTSGVDFGDSADTNIGRLLYDNSDNSMRFTTNASEAMRIDSSGNLLVGTTTTQNLGTVNSGSLIRDGYIQVASTDATATLAYFYSAAGQVGSIGVDNSDNLFIQGNSTHVGFQFASSAVVPHKNGATIDNNVNLGSASDRFKDLYLSGGVFLGGTGSANKLDDYEEGTWTPAISGIVSNPTVTYAYRSGYYRRVGGIVTVSWRLNVTSISGGSSLARIINLPFTSSGGTQSHVQIAALSSMSGPSTYNGGFVEPANAFIYLNDSSGNTFNVTSLGTGIFWGSVTYRA